MSVVTITPSAQTYLAELLAKQDVKNLAIRVSVAQPGTPSAETCFNYCPPGDEQETDHRVDFADFHIFIDSTSEPFLKEASVDYQEDKFGGQLTIKAPNAKVPAVAEDSPLEDKINYLLATEINPNLASHGGMVTLVELTADNYAVLQFGGGCQGCGMVDTTLQQGVEKTLKEKLPELAGVKDMTDHSVKENAYFK